MATSPSDVQALIELEVAVQLYHLEDTIGSAFNCFYIYYVLTTIGEEARTLLSLITPASQLPPPGSCDSTSKVEPWKSAICDDPVRYIVMHRYKPDPTHFEIEPEVCKAMLITANAIALCVACALSLSLGLCLGALLQVQGISLAAILFFSSGLSFVESLIYVVTVVQYPAEKRPQLLAELGYPCYVLDQLDDQKMNRTVLLHSNLEVRAYLDLSATIILAILGSSAFLCRYRGQPGKLLQVLRRDGGMHYLSLLVIKAFTVTGLIVSSAVLTVGKPYSFEAQTDARPKDIEFDGFPLWVLTKVFQVSSLTIVPILAQRLLINMRKVDYMGSRPVASKLLFAPPPPGSEDDLDGWPDSFEMAPGPSGARLREIVTREASERERDEEAGTSHGPPTSQQLMEPTWIEVGGNSLPSARTDYANESPHIDTTMAS